MLIYLCFYPRDAVTVLCTSVCLSVTNLNCIKMTERIQLVIDI